jgi:two-component system chemotaxis response regulator CheB
VVTGPHTTSIVRGPRENGHRPSIDVLFRTAAAHLGPRVVAVVLSGSDDDGSVGCLAVRERGGIVLTQTVEDALYPLMPASAARAASVASSAPADLLGAEVAAAVQGSGTAARSDAWAWAAADPGRRGPAVGRPGREGVAASAAGPGRQGQGRTSILDEEAAVDENSTDAVLGTPVGPPSGFVCPDCSGALFVAAEEPVLRFRCRIGHAWSAENLVAQQDMTVETALWTAVRTLQEKAELAERLAQRAQREARTVTARRYRESSAEAHRSAAVLKDLLSVSPPDTPSEAPLGAENTGDATGRGA